MAEVIANELTNSNGNVEDENDDKVKLKYNGDTGDEKDDCSPSDDSCKVSKDKCSNKKFSSPSDLVPVPDGQPSDKGCNVTVANGRFKSQTFSSERVDENDTTASNTIRDESASVAEKRSEHVSNCDNHKSDSGTKARSNVAKTKAKTADANRTQNDASSKSKDATVIVVDSSKTSINVDDDDDDERPDDVRITKNHRTADTVNDDVERIDAATADLESDANDDDTESRKKSNNVGDNETQPVGGHNDAGDVDDVISITSTPEKVIKKVGKKSLPAMTAITPRRSSRNLNKQKSYAERDNDFEDGSSASSGARKRNLGEDDEIEEVTPTDPLADEPRTKVRNKTIVVSDTKGLVEFASNAKASRSNKKEPTLVIIDTNSILSGRGPVPVSQQSTASSLLHSSSSSAPIPVSLPIPAGAFASATRGASSSSGFSVIPIGLPAQGMYSQFKNPPPQIKPIVVGPASTTVTAVPLSTNANVVPATTITTVTATGTAAKQPPVILPSLTDDMFVVEAPSFIVPYVYEKPPMKSLKEHIDRIENDIKEAEKKQELEQKKRETDEKTDDGGGDDDDSGSVAANEDDDADSSKTTAENRAKNEEDVDEKKDSAETDKSGDECRNDVDDTADSSVASKSGTDKEAGKKDAECTAKESEKKTATAAAAAAAAADDCKKPSSYFDNPLGKFFMQIGLNLVQEHVQTDLLRSQKRKRDKEGSRCSQDVHSAIDELTKTLESSKENNDPFKLELKKCELCSFKTESLLVMAHHLETPHMKNYTYRCNFCPLEVRSPHDILFHMEAEHNIRGRLERAPAFHQCPNCPFEDNQKGKLTRHLISCSKKYRPERNQEPPLDWEPPAKIPRVTRNRPPSMSPGNAVYQAAMSGLKQVPQNTLLPKLMPNTSNMKHNMLSGNKRPNIGATFVNRFANATQPNFQQRQISVQTSNQSMMYRSATAGANNSQTQVLLPQGYQLSGAQIYQQNQNSKSQSTQQGLAAAKLLNQPSISITPLPRQTSTQTSGSNNTSTASTLKPGKPGSTSGGKGTFVVCEICDGYIKDLEQLRNHMQWIHKVKIHPKMIYNRPPLNCQKCQFRFFTDQGLERHLLGSHGLVTSSMQEAANKGKDGGRCPVCGRVYQWKLLNHVARDHQMALKPAHLSYKCTVCTATFGMYKQFESHVYSAHSVVAKRAMDTSKKPSAAAATSSQNDTLLKPLKINDEITIIPQPVRSTKPINKVSNATTITATVSNSKGKNDEEDQLCKCSCLVEDFSDNEEFRRHVCERHLKNFKIRLTRVDLKLFKEIANKANSYKLTQGVLVADELKKRFELKDFFVEIKRLPVDAHTSYKIVDDDEFDAIHVVDSVYSDVDEEDDAKTRRIQPSRPPDMFVDKKRTTTLLDANDTRRRSVHANKSQTCEKRRVHQLVVGNVHSADSSSDVDTAEEGRTNLQDHSHFLLGARNGQATQSACSLRQTAQQYVLVSRTVSTSQTTTIPSSQKTTATSSFTCTSKQTTTTSTILGHAIAEALCKPRAVYSNTEPRSKFGTSSNSLFSGAMQYCRQRSGKMKRSSNGATKTTPTSSSISTGKENDVISLLSDSDDSAVEIIESDGEANEAEDVYILPT